MIAAMVERRSCLSQLYWIGVCPRGAQVRRTTGWSIKPLSSMKTMLRLSLWAFFEPEAIPPGASFQWPSHLAPALFSPASGNSNPSCVVCTRHNRGDTSPRRAVLSPEPLVPESTDQWQSLLLGDLSARLSSKFPSALASNGWSVSDVAWPSVPQYRALRETFSSGLPRKGKLRPDAPLHELSLIHI